MEPYVTLFHWDTPYALEQEYGGFLSEDIVNDFRDFAELCFWEFGDRVKYWMTLNEPWTYCVNGYVSCNFPPGAASSPPPPAPATAPAPAAAQLPLSTTDPIMYNFVPYRGSEIMQRSNLNFIPHRAAFRHDYNLITSAKSSGLENLVLDKTQIEKSGRNSINGFLTLSTPTKDVYTVGKNLLLAHAAAVQSYRTKFKAHQNGQIGIALVSCCFEPLNKDDEEDRKAAVRARDFMLGWFLEPVLSGRYPLNMIDNVSALNLPPFKSDEVDLLKGSIDFLGLNYYTSFYASHDPDPKITSGYNKDQNLAIYRVDEKNDHGLTAYQACKDTHRIKYHQDHLGNILKAMNDKDGKVNVKGYFAWSFCDNFEWQVGYTSRFGIIYIDYMNHLRRHPKESATWFSKFLVKNKSGDNKGSGNNVSGANANQSGDNKSLANNVSGANQSGDNKGSGNNVSGANANLSGDNNSSGKNVSGANKPGNNKGKAGLDRSGLRPIIVRPGSPVLMGPFATWAILVAAPSTWKSQIPSSEVFSWNIPVISETKSAKAWALKVVRGR
ncbi:UNVERIFIED_CONTAM: Oleuropein beta-glucosidase [Sesamum calycinum]|uniref:Oleuropein beta-glucosidase n=1 Tax=Sesamum calycinum TaxID=2727403 RepID=A0AAW2IXN8_9LAMI